MANVSFKDWQNLDIRIAKITKVKEHPNADKLQILEIDLGKEKRQVVAGLKEYYKDKVLVGKQIAVIVNLEPATLRGVKSDGMLLAVVERGKDGKESKVILLAPEKKVANGAKIE